MTTLSFIANGRGEDKCRVCRGRTVCRLSINRSIEIEDDKNYIPTLKTKMVQQDLAAMSRFNFTRGALRALSFQALMLLNFPEGR